MMDFECDFNNLNFCQYSNLGWGFQKSVLYAHEVKAALNLPNQIDYFPCSVSNSAREISQLERKYSSNTSQSFCLWFAYLLEGNGHITVSNGNDNWSQIAKGAYLHWKQMRFPINFHKTEHSSDIGYDSTILKITGQSVCVDNFTISNKPCPLSSTIFDNSFSFNPTLWLMQPLNILVAILTLVGLLIAIVLISSIIFARKSQRELSRSRQLSRKLKETRSERYSIQNSPQNATITNSCFDIDTLESSDFFSHTNRCLPTVVHVRSNPQLVRYSRKSFAASSSTETNESTPHFRFSLALTEDAKMQLITSNSNNAMKAQGTLSVVRQQSIMSTHTQELPHNLQDSIDSQKPSISVIVSTVCAPILDQPESDLSTESLNVVDQVSNNRRRPIRESLNIGYVSEGSLSDLPQYDTAVQLLAEQRLLETQSLEIAGDSIEEMRNNDDIVEMEY